MAFDYARTRATADRLISKFGQPGTIRRIAARTGGEPWNPGSATGGISTDYPCTLVVLDYDARERAGTLIAETDRKALIAAGGLEIEPQGSDHVVVGGVSHPIKELSPLAPGGVTVLYECRIGG